MDKPLVKLILFVVFVIVAQIFSAYKKSQAEAARRRALLDSTPPQRPPTRPRGSVLEEERDEFEVEDEPEYPDDAEELEPQPQPEPQPELAPPTWKQAAPVYAPPPRPVGVGSVMEAPGLRLTPLPPPARLPSGFRLDRARARAAVLMAEVIGPPVALRGDRDRIV